MSPEERIEAAESYLAARTGCFEWRCERYDTALKVMHEQGLDDEDTVVDVGSGWGEFGVRLHTGRQAGLYDYPGWELKLPPSRARYIPVDAAIDGTDLEVWSPRDAEWFVCLEVLEHLANPARLLTEMIARAGKGVIVSTPNPETTDVLGMDATHKTPIRHAFLEMAGMSVYEASFYGKDRDSLFGVWSG